MKIKNAPFIKTPHRLRLLFTKLLTEFTKADLFAQAAAMAYTTLLSLIPSLAAVFILLSLFNPMGADGSNQDLTSYLKNFLVNNLTPKSAEQVSGVLENLLENLSLTKIGISSILGLFVSLSLLLRQIEMALNKVFGIRKERNIFTRFVHFWTFMTLGIFFASIGTSMLGGFNLDLNQWIGDSSNQPQTHSIWQSFIPFAGSFVFFVALYQLVPNTKVSFKYSCVGAFIVSILFKIASWAFTLYITKFASQEAIYGALAALPVFLTWLYLCWVVILFGGFIVAKLQFGLPDITNSEQEKVTISEAFHQSIWNSYLPVLCLVQIYQNFTHAKQPTTSDLAEIYNVENSKIEDACIYLEELKLICTKAGPSEKWIATQPADQIKLVEVAQKIWPETSTKKAVECFEPQWKRLLESIASGITQNKNLSNILESCD